MYKKKQQGTKDWNAEKSSQKHWTQKCRQQLEEKFFFIFPSSMAPFPLSARVLSTFCCCCFVFWAGPLDLQLLWFDQLQGIRHRHHRARPLNHSASSKKQSNWNKNHRRGKERYWTCQELNAKLSIWLSTIICLFFVFCVKLKKSCGF